MTQRPVKLKALFVDDEPMILEGLSQLFDMTYDVYTACSGQEAIDYARQTPDLAIVVSDQRMPGLKGIDVLRAIKEISPDTIRILLTGFADADAILDSVNVGEVFRYVRKPWNPDELTALLSLAAATYLDRKKIKAKAQPKIPEPAPSLSALPSLQNLALPELQKQQTIEENFLDRLAKFSEHSVERAFHSESGKPKILVVDDEQGVLTALSQLLSDSYEVFTARSADEAMELLRKDSFMTLLLTDQRMPKKTGTDFLIESREMAPLVPKILITAYTDVEDIIRLINEGQIYRYIQKPWDPEKLRATIHEAIEIYLYQVKSKLGEYEHDRPTTDHHSRQQADSSASANHVLNSLQALSQMVKQQSNSPNT
jgi:response regulator RpfG family c-di-GMP phosphodiesterase